MSINNLGNLLTKNYRKNVTHQFLNGRFLKSYGLYWFGYFLRFEDMAEEFVIHDQLKLIVFDTFSMIVFDSV